MEPVETDTPEPPFSIGVRMPREMRDRIREIAAREQNALASVCRRLIAASLAREPEPPVIR